MGVVVQEGDEEQVARLLAELPAPSTLAGYRVSPLIFEKDDDTNFHIDFITAASNLRARNYSVPPPPSPPQNFLCVARVSRVSWAG